MTDDVRVYWADMTPTEQVMAEQVARLQVRAHAAEEAVKRVRELHRPTDDPDTDPDDRWCIECERGWDGHDWNVVSWPCQTVKALDGE